jgi:hypothetical protein
MRKCCVCSSEESHIEYVNEIFQINGKFRNFSITAGSVPVHSSESGC